MFTVSSTLSHKLCAHWFSNSRCLWK